MQRTNPQDLLAARETQLQGLLLRGLAGDAQAYREFLAALALHVRGFLKRRLQQRPAEVEDLLQEVLLAVHNARQTYQPQQPLTAWVQAIARYKLADYLRRYAHHDALHDLLDDDSDLFAASDEAPAQASRDLGKLLGQLRGAPALADRPRQARGPVGGGDRAYHWALQFGSQGRHTPWAQGLGQADSRQ
ncbi:RNA polymerase sigma-70 factor (ECF subfamily) [Pseudomonas sp. Y3 TE3536]